jgi:hypothetical protein
LSDSVQLSGEEPSSWAAIVQDANSDDPRDTHRHELGRAARALGRGGGRVDVIHDVVRQRRRASQQRQRRRCGRSLEPQPPSSGSARTTASRSNASTQRCRRLAHRFNRSGGGWRQSAWRPLEATHVPGWHRMVSARLGLDPPAAGRPLGTKNGIHSPALGPMTHPHPLLPHSPIAGNGPSELGGRVELDGCISQ